MFDKIKKNGTMFIAMMFVFFVQIYTEMEYSFKKYILPYLPKYFEKTLFYFIENGQIVCKSYNVDEMRENISEFKCIDFAIHKEYDEENEKYDVFVFDNIRNYSNKEFKQCKKHFMSVELDVNDKKYEIHMDRNNNYYIENNEVLFFEFLQYVLYNEYGAYIIFDDEYTITIVDNDCNIVTMDKTQYIKFSSNKYEIITRKKNINEQEETEQEIENILKMEEEIEMERKRELETIQEMELEEAESYLEYEDKMLESQIESYYSDKKDKKDK